MDGARPPPGRGDPLDPRASWVGGDHAKLRWIALERLEKFLSREYWTEVNANSDRCLSPLATVQLEVWTPRGVARPSFAQAMRGAEFEPCEVGHVFGPAWSSHWVRVRARVPDGARSPALVFDAGCEAAVYSEDGRILQGLTGGGGDDRRHLYRLGAAAAGSRATLLVEVACNGMFGVGKGGMIEPPDEGRSFALARAELVDVDDEFAAFQRDLEFVVALARELPDGDPTSGHALRVANHAVNLVRVDERGTWARGSEAAEALAAFLASGAAPPPPGAGPECRQPYAAGEAVHAVGHAHIDTAWLWPFGETRRKCARSWSTQAALMERDPDYRFAVSQAIQMKWVREDHPELWQRLRGLAAAGQLVPVGGLVVEMDANLPCAEALVRQGLYGQRFFVREFGRRSDVYWLPDTFGYAAALPTIAAGLGMPSFVSQKLSWNLVNRFPHTSMVWEGLDGTEVLAHFPPANTYNSSASVGDLLRSRAPDNAQRGTVGDLSLLLFGHGDGGGGPTPDHLARLHRARACPGLPRVQLSTPAAFFERLGRVRRGLPRHRGGLYLEMHRGVFTTAGRVKHANRRAEVLLHRVEGTMAMAAARGAPLDTTSPACAAGAAAEGETPRERELWRLDRAVEAVERAAAGGHGVPLAAWRAAVEQLWEYVLLCAFHDVITGTSIASAMREAEGLYEVVLGRGARLAAAAEVFLACGGAAVTAVNALGVPHRGLPPLTHAVSAPRDGSATSTAEAAPGGGAVLRSADAEVVVLPDGRLGSFVAGGREYLSEPEGNRLVLRDDVPFFWDAWDTIGPSQQKERPVPAAKSVRVAEGGGGAVEVRYAFGRRGGSELVQTLTLRGRLLEVDTAADWRERHTLLRAEFPLALRADHFSCEVQYGIERQPTTRGNPVEEARFEVCAQRFAALAEPGCGAALINDSRHGYSCEGSVLALSLLRSPRSPDPDVDAGRHRFRYALLPFAGPLASSGVVAEARRFNAAQGPSARPAVAPLLEVAAAPGAEGGAVPVLDWLKLAEEQPPDGVALVARLYEPHGASGAYELRAGVRLRRAELCANLLEDEGEAVKVEPRGRKGSAAVGLWARPFGVHTVKLVLV